MYTFWVVMGGISWGIPSTEGRSVCLCWAHSQPKGTQGGWVGGSLWGGGGIARTWVTWGGPGIVSSAPYGHPPKQHDGLSDNLVFAGTSLSPNSCISKPETWFLGCHALAQDAMGSISNAFSDLVSSDHLFYCILSPDGK